jgi:hypothetical protein
MRVVQLGLILFFRELYWRIRTGLNFVVKAYVGSFVIGALITARVSRHDYFFSSEWLGGEGGVVTSDVGIYRALMLPAGCLLALCGILAHQVPWRLMAGLQIWTAAVSVSAAWGPVSQLLHHHQKLADDAFWMCELAGEGMSLIAGLGGGWQLSQRGACAGPGALTRTVLATQVRVSASDERASRRSAPVAPVALSTCL